MPPNPKVVSSVKLAHYREFCLVANDAPGVVSWLNPKGRTTDERLNMGRYASGIVAACLVLIAAPCFAINVVIDYSDDSFFTSHLTAKAALEAAAVDISTAITTTLGPTVDSNTASFGGASATFNFNLRYTNPTTGATQTISSAVLPSDEVRVYAGVRDLTGSTLGQGGPGGFGVNVSASGTFANRSQAVAMAAAAANANVGRGDGPAIGNLSGSVSGIAYSIDYGAALGNMWFDADTDNNGVADNDTTLNSYWHFDHTTPVGFNKADFYSVALHEILHALGIGTAKSWDALVSSSDSRDWLGPEVIALAGSGDNILASDSSHIAEGTMSVRLDGQPQEAVMDPSITLGTRKKLTLLDLAFLRDIGWDTVPLSIPGDFDDSNTVNAADIDILWRIVRGTGIDPGGNDSADLNGDSFVNEDDVDYMLASLLTAGSNRRYGDASLSGGEPDLVDYNLWRTGTGGWGGGDFDGSGGAPELNDYNLWRTGPTQFPGSVGSHSGGPGGPLVPEPATLVLMGLGLPAIIIGARRGTKCVVGLTECRGSSGNRG